MTAAVPEQARPERPSQPTNVLISLLVAGQSPRLDGENTEHVTALAQTDSGLPPIIVQRSTMRVIDGMHRLRAAMLRGDTHIEAQLFDGTDDEAFILAVRANSAHGLPLSLADRKAAAVRIVASRSEWSDRAVADIVGISPNTVAALRKRCTDEIARLRGTSRLGRDGRVRPLDSRVGRRIAGEMLADDPHVSLRTVAKAAGISPATALDVRRRLARGDEADWMPRQAGPARQCGPAGAGRRMSDMELVAALGSLRGDPSLRFTESGRQLLRMLDVLALGMDNASRIIGGAPPHCVRMVADIAHECAVMWGQLARHKAQSVATGQESTIERPTASGDL